MGDKKSLLQLIDVAAQTYGKKVAGYWLHSEFSDIGFYMEDHRKSKVEFAKQCVENCYKDIPSEPPRTADSNDYWSWHNDNDTNKELVNAVKDAIAYMAKGW